MTEHPDNDAVSLDALRARRLSQISSLVAIGLSVAMVGYLVDRNWLILSLLLPGVMVMLVCQWLSRRGQINFATTLFLYALTALVALMMWVSEGLQDVALLSFPALLILAGLLVRGRTFFLLLLVMVVYLVVVTMATEVFHWRSNGYISPPMEQLRDVLTILAVSGMVVWLVLSDLQKAMLRLQVQITSYRESQAQLTYLSQHDNLTGLANRTLGRERIERAIAAARRQRRRVALLFVDLDNFKSINDSLGHAAGDEFLRQVAQRLSGAVRASDIVARQGGDEFVLGLTDVDDVADASAVAAAALQRMDGLFEIRDTQVSSSCSIGIAIFPEDGEDYEALLRKADTAMYRAKEAGRNLARFYDAGMQDDLQNKLQLVASLRQALVAQELVLHYQPVVELASGRLVGAEALLRWQHPTQGLLLPGHFIAAAERSGLIVDMGAWVLEAACRDAARWQRPEQAVVVAVNLSPVQFRRGNLDEVVERALRESGLPGCCLELEITESTLVDDTERFVQSLGRLKALGVSIAIDDFGTGYSNLGYLQRFAVDKLKIDQTFVRAMGEGAQQHALVAAIVQMAKALNLTCHAEGIEDEAVRDSLRTLGCELGQGYWFARPQTLQAFEAALPIQPP
jgi:diguanylate cyclase